jgi:hypothetical protein
MLPNIHTHWYQLGPPPQIHSVVAAPKIVANAFCCQSLWVSVGQTSHIKFWSWKPNDAERLGYVKVLLISLYLSV